VKSADLGKGVEREREKDWREREREREKVSGCWPPEVAGHEGVPIVDSHHFLFFTTSCPNQSIQALTQRWEIEKNVICWMDWSTPPYAVIDVTVVTTVDWFPEYFLFLRFFQSILPFSPKSQIHPHSVPRPMDSCHKTTHWQRSLHLKKVSAFIKQPSELTDFSSLIRRSWDVHPLWPPKPKGRCHWVRLSPHGTPTRNAERTWTWEEKQGRRRKRRKRETQEFLNGWFSSTSEPQFEPAASSRLWKMEENSQKCPSNINLLSATNVSHCHISQFTPCWRKRILHFGFEFPGDFDLEEEMTKQRAERGKVLFVDQHGGLEGSMGGKRGERELASTENKDKNQRSEVQITFPYPEHDVISIFSKQKVFFSGNTDILGLWIDTPHTILINHLIVQSQLSDTIRRGQWWSKRERNSRDERKPNERNIFTKKISIVQKMALRHSKEN
jgi:hypothetical protein